MRKILLSSLILIATLAGCSESANSESGVTIKVVSGGASNPSTYMAVYDPDEIEDYVVRSNGILSIYLKDGSKIETSMFTIETRGGKN